MRNYRPHSKTKNYFKKKSTNKTTYKIANPRRLRMAVVKINLGVNSKTDYYAECHRRWARHKPN